MPQQYHIFQLTSALSFVLFLQNYQINACPSSVQNNEICVKVLQQQGEGWSVHLGLPAAIPLHLLTGRDGGGHIVAIQIPTIYVFFYFSLLSFCVCVCVGGGGTFWD